MALANVGREHPDGLYDPDNLDSDRDGLVADWRGVREGKGFSCHLTEADRQVYPITPADVEAGYVMPPAHAERRECAGVAAALVRELRRLSEAGSWEAYVSRWPRGLTREAMVVAHARYTGKRTPPLRPQVDPADITDVPSWDIPVKYAATDTQLAQLVALIPALGEKSS